MVTPSPARFLVVNADDFGMASGVNEGIKEAHRHGIVTSASLMVRGPEAVQAASYARHSPRLSIGLHVDLGEWAYQQGEWVERYRVVALHDHQTVAGEVERQLSRFRSLVGRNPSHLDSHQHAHRHEPVRSVLTAIAARLGLPLREHSVIRYEGAFYGQGGRGEPYPEGITVQALSAILEHLPEGWTELGCHPAEGPVDDVYGPERAKELEALCDPRIRDVLDSHGIELRTFDDLDAATGRPTVGL